MLNDSIYVTVSSLEQFKIDMDKKGIDVRELIGDKPTSLITLGQFARDKYDNYIVEIPRDFNKAETMNSDKTIDTKTKYQIEKKVVLDGIMA